MPVDKGETMHWRIGEILIQKNLISWPALDEALEEQHKTHEFIGDILIRNGKIGAILFYQALAKQFSLQFVDLKKIYVNPKAVDAIPKSIAKKFSIMPIEFQDSILIVAISNPLKYWPVDEIRKIANANTVKQILAIPADIEYCINENYPKADRSNTSADDSSNV